LAWIFGLVRLGLFELRLIRPRVDLHQQISLLHKLAFGKGNLEDIPVDPALDDDCVVGLRYQQRAQSLAVSLRRLSPCGTRYGTPFCATEHTLDL
jgi:hypothetical protein